MYYQIWKKYLPVIRILLKKSVSCQQMLALNKTDFERGGLHKKAGHRFKIKFTGGRVSNIISDSAMASHLAQLMMDDDATRNLLKENNFEIDFNTKFQLTITHQP